MTLHMEYRDKQTKENVALLKEISKETDEWRKRHGARFEKGKICACALYKKM